MTAGFLLVARVFKLGFLADFLSRTVLIGFLAGVGLQVSIVMLGDMTGVSFRSQRTLIQVWQIIENLAHPNRFRSSIVDRSAPAGRIVDVTALRELQSLGSRAVEINLNQFRGTCQRGKPDRRATLQPRGFEDEDASIACHWKPGSIQTNREGYGRWINFLISSEADLTADPADRVTPERVSSYVTELAALALQTRANRISQLMSR